MTIEELYKLIDEIEKDNLEYRNIVRDRKKRRIIKERKRKIRKVLSYYIPLSLMGVMSLQTFVDSEINNIYDDNALKISEEKAYKIKETIETKLNMDIEEDELEEYLLLNAILKNLSLNQQEKQIICKEIINIIRINPYINKEQVYQALLKLKIFYMERPQYKSSNIQGECIIINSIFFNIDNIYIYTEEDDLVLEHELIHILLMNMENIDAPYFIKEGLVELLTNEFFGGNPYIITKCYPFESLAVKMLCEITDPNIVLESYTKGNMNMLYQQLEKINKNIDAKKFIKVLDDVLIKKTQNQEKDKNKINYLINSWKEYFLASPNAEPQISNYYLNLFKSLESDNSYISLIIKIDKYGYVEKTYYNKNIDKHKTKVKKISSQL